MDKTRKVVLITGGARGIGAACATAFAKAGYVVAIGYHNSALKARELAKELGAQGYAAQAFCADVADKAQVDAMFAQVQNALGGVDILVNNAGIAQQKLFTDITEEDWDTMFGVCVKGAFHCCQAALPHMLRQKWGRIINISSMWGQTGASCEVHYSCAKAALIGLTKALAKEEGPSKITVNCVAPGVVDTDMMADFSPEEKDALAQETPLCRLGVPRDIAASVLFLASEQADFITGQVLGVNGGFVI